LKTLTADDPDVTNVIESQNTLKVSQLSAEGSSKRQIANGEGYYFSESQNRKPDPFDSFSALILLLMKAS